MSEFHSTAPVEYRPIPDYPGYLAGSDGSIWSFWNRRSHVMRDEKNELRKARTPNGYERVMLCNSSGHKNFLVHRLILTAFRGEASEGMESCHNNGVRHDNRIENLRWDTRKGNHADKIAHGTSQRGSRGGTTVLTEDDVHEIRRRLVFGESQSQVAADFGVHQSTISLIRCGKKWEWLESPVMPKRSTQSRRVLWQ